MLCKKLDRVHPSTIYFAYDQEKDLWKPYQMVSDKHVQRSYRLLGPENSTVH